MIYKAIIEVLLFCLFGVLGVAAEIAGVSLYYYFREVRDEQGFAFFTVVIMPVAFVVVGLLGLLLRAYSG